MRKIWPLNQNVRKITTIEFEFLVQIFENSISEFSEALYILNLTLVFFTNKE